LIVVDTSVWIDFLNGRNAPHVTALRAALGQDEIIIGDLMLSEVPQGLENEAQQVESLLRRFDIAPMTGDTIAARNYRALRRRGITIRKAIDLLIGTWCIENRRPLLHNDSDFRPMARYLGLVEVPAKPRGEAEPDRAKKPPKSGPFSLLLAEIALYSAPSHTETWLIRPSGGSRAEKARLLTRFRRNQPEN
jgi:predicted nucleic acid-binding protein